MIETAIELTEARISGAEVQRIIEWGHVMLRHPVELLEGVRETIESLNGRYRLILLTKGDLFDQESKLARSGLGEYFDAVEIVSAKNAATYRSIMQRHEVAPERFVMVGNSLRSDVLPALEAGGRAVHIPYALTWAHERIEEQDLAGKEFVTLEKITHLPDWLTQRAG
ncbi:MAG TPA: HAD family hydrolase [Thermoanaerobaculia bacterium]|nr:HAD family hydrolase [Thermoanaerobaculia bacterium]